MKRIFKLTNDKEILKIVKRNLEKLSQKKEWREIFKVVERVAKGNPERCCFTCRHLKFGWSTKPSWHWCDYVCHIEDESGVKETFLLCTHGLSKEEIERRLREMGRDCESWEEKENEN